MLWGQLLGAVALSVALLALGGAPIALSLRLRGLWLVAATPVLGVSIVVAATLAAAVLGIAWSIWPLVGVASVGAVAATAVGWFVPRARARAIPSNRGRVTAGAATVAAVLVGTSIVLAMGSPEYFAQEFDNVFHLNAVRFILDVGDASPSGVPKLTAPQGEGMYPSAWAALNALVVQLSGVSIPVASNAVLLAIACWVWPAGMLLLTRTWFGHRTSTLMAAAVLVGGFTAYPLLLVGDIGAYPMVLSIALLPFALAALAHAAGISTRSPGWQAALLLLGLASLALLGAHPSGVAALIVFSLPVVIWLIVRLVRRTDLASWRLIAGLGVATYVALTLVGIQYLQPSGPSSPRLGTLGQSIGEALAVSAGGQVVSLATASLTIVGVVSALRRRTPARIAAVGLWVIAMTLYAVAAGGDGVVRLFLTRSWFTDPMRLAALTPIAVAPLAALGATVVWEWALRQRPLRTRLRSGGARAGLAAAALTLLAFTQLPAMSAVTGEAHRSFIPTDDATIARLALGEDERVLIEHLKSRVRPGEVVAGNPWNGSSFAYALSGTSVLLPHQLGPRSPEQEAFLDGFATADEGDPACEAARGLGVRWVLDFRREIPLPSPAPTYDGLSGLDRSSNVELAERIGDAYLYRVVGCGV